MFNTVKSDRSIVYMYQYIEGLQVLTSKTLFFSSLKIDLLLANITDSDEIQHFAVFHPSRQCLPKYPFRNIQSIDKDARKCKLLIRRNKLPIFRISQSIHSQ